VKSFLAALLLIGCLPNCVPEKKPEAPMLTMYDRSCIEACDNAQSMQCEFGKRSRGGTCFEVCFIAIANGVPIPTGCITRATSCSEIDWCEKVTE